MHDDPTRVMGQPEEPGRPGGGRPHGNMRLAIAGLIAVIVGLVIAIVVIASDGGDSEPATTTAPTAAETTETVPPATETTEPTTTETTEPTTTETTETTTEPTTAPPEEDEEEDSGSGGIEAE